MRQQIGDQEAFFVVLLAQTEVDAGPVELHHSAVQSERDSGPLVLLDAAVVMRLKHRQTAVLIKRVGLEVDAGGVYMGDGEAHAVVGTLLAYDRQTDILLTVDDIYAIAGLILLILLIFNKAVLNGELLDIGHSLALGA